MPQEKSRRPLVPRQWLPKPYLDSKPIITGCLDLSLPVSLSHTEATPTYALRFNSGHHTQSQGERMAPDLKVLQHWKWIMQRGLCVRVCPDLSLWRSE